MRILTLENTAYEMNDIPDEVDDLRFAILDNSNPADPDYFFIPLIFLESFNSPAVVLEIGNHKIRMPVDWKILIGDRDVGDLEMLAFSSLNDRGFDAFTFNPLSSPKPDFYPIDVVDIYTEVKWYFPKIKSGQMLAVPLNNGPKPMCAYFVKDISRQCEQVDYGSVW